jgi:hypothetical protein
MSGCKKIKKALLFKGFGEELDRKKAHLTGLIRDE